MNALFKLQLSGAFRKQCVIDTTSDTKLIPLFHLRKLTDDILTHKQGATYATVDIKTFCEYVREYMKFSPLRKKDMIAMPYVYLFQLARSKYGYPQYLNSNSEDREGLLQFAFWRTQMCQEVEKKAETISNELLKL